LGGGWKVSLLLGLVGVAFGIAVFEIASRVMLPDEAPEYTYDHYRGMAPIANLTYWQTDEGKALVQINSQRMRDKEHSKEKPANTIRIAVLGDSYAEAIQVPVEDTFWSVMEREIASCSALSGKRVEALNFGVAGYGTTQELITLRHLVWGYAPDVVLLAVTTGNDVRNNSKELEPFKGVPFYIRDGEALVLDNSFRELWAQKKEEAQRFPNSVLRQSRTWNIVSKWFGSHTIAATNENQELGLNDEVYMPPPNSDWEEAWRITEELLAIMHSEVRDKGARFLLVTLSNDIQVNPDKKAREEFRRKLGAEDLFYPEMRFTSIGEREGFEVLTLAPQMQSWVDQHGVSVHGFGGKTGGHWNAQGHKLAGDAIAERLCRDMTNFE